MGQVLPEWGHRSLSIGFTISLVTVLSCAGEFVKVLSLPSVGKLLNLFGECIVLQKQISQRFKMADSWNACCTHVNEAPCRHDVTKSDIHLLLWINIINSFGRMNSRLVCIYLRRHAYYIIVTRVHD